MPAGSPSRAWPIHRLTAAHVVRARSAERELNASSSSVQTVRLSPEVPGRVTGVDQRPFLALRRRQHLHPADLGRRLQLRSGILPGGVLSNGDVFVVFNNSNTPTLVNQQLGVHVHVNGDVLTADPPVKVGVDDETRIAPCDFGRGAEQCVDSLNVRSKDFPSLALDPTNGNHPDEPEPAGQRRAGRVPRRLLQHRGEPDKRRRPHGLVGHAQLELRRSGRGRLHLQHGFLSREYVRRRLLWESGVTIWACCLPGASRSPRGCKRSAPVPVPPCGSAFAGPRVDAPRVPAGTHARSERVARSGRVAPVQGRRPGANYTERGLHANPDWHAT